MSTQTTLFGTDTIDQRFADYHAEHPEVYQLLVRLARKAKESGRKTLGIKAIWERARWEYYIERAENDFKLNNDFTSRYARLMMKQEADLDGFFHTRKLTAA